MEVLATKHWLISENLTLSALWHKNSITTWALKTLSSSNFWFSYSVYIFQFPFNPIFRETRNDLLPARSPLDLLQDCFICLCKLVFRSFLWKLANIRNCTSTKNIFKKCNFYRPAFLSLSTVSVPHKWFASHRNGNGAWSFYEHHSVARA
jgi:hypothetical protein